MNKVILDTINNFFSKYNCYVNNSLIISSDRLDGFSGDMTFNFYCKVYNIYFEEEDFSCNVNINYTSLIYSNINVDLIVTEKIIEYIDSKLEYCEYIFNKALVKEELSNELKINNKEERKNNKI